MAVGTFGCGGLVWVGLAARGWTGMTIHLFFLCFCLGEAANAAVAAPTITPTASVDAVTTAVLGVGVGIMCGNVNIGTPTQLPQHGPNPHNIDILTLTGGKNT